jgi:hypothetical protein
MFIVIRSGPAAAAATPACARGKIIPCSTRPGRRHVNAIFGQNITLFEIFFQISFGQENDFFSVYKFCGISSIVALYIC